MSDQLNYGGQAVIEGVMMRGSRALSVAVRNPAGDIVVHTEPLNQTLYQRWMKIPFLRGLVLLWDALGLGIKSLMFSADIAIEDEDESAAFDKPAQIGTVLLSLTMAIGLFIVFPAFIGGLAERWLFDGRTAVYFGHAAEGVTRLLLLIGYITLIGKLEDIRRLYAYHGAEHKTINAYEAGAPLTPSSVARFPLEHPRCGTAFLLTVVILSIILFTLIPLEPLTRYMPALLARVLTRLALLPVVAGLAYEYLRFSARNLDNRLIRILTRPNLALQRLTTREPQTDMLEVAIVALQQVLAYESGDVEVADTVQTFSAEPPVPAAVTPVPAGHESGTAL